MKYCEKCGNELFDEAVICPKCGCAVRYEKTQRTGKPSAQVNASAPINVCALVGFILSLSSILSILNVFGLLAIAGVINSVIGLVNCTREKHRGKVFAIVGIIVGAVFGVIGLYAWIGFVSDDRSWLVLLIPGLI